MKITQELGLIGWQCGNLNYAIKKRILSPNSNWVAINIDGCIFEFKDRPVAAHGMWDATNGTARVNGQIVFVGNCRTIVSCWAETLVNIGEQS